MIKKELIVSPRSDKGKGSARKLRREGQIPAILYGRGVAPQALSLNIKALGQAVGNEEEETSHLFILRMEGNSNLDNQLVMVKEIQKDPVHGHYLHVDLQQISLDQKIKATVSIQFQGKAAGLAQGGILQPGLRTLDIECLPTQIPDHISVDVSALEIGNTLHIRDLSLPEGVELAQPSDLLVVTVVPPIVEEVRAPVEEVPAEAKPEEAKEEEGE